jgi:uncharacterized protein
MATPTPRQESTGPQVDDEGDYDLPCWAGVLPFHVGIGEPIADPWLAPGITVPATVSRYRRS